MDRQKYDTFREQWHGIHDVVLSEAKRQIKFYGKVNAQRLTKKMQFEIAKWSQGVLAQGIWFQEFHHAEPNKALTFMTEAMKLSIEEPSNNKLPSNNGYFVLAFVLAGIVAWLLHAHTNLSWLEQCFYPVLFLVVLNTVLASLRNKRKAKAENDIACQISNQINDMGDRLQKIIEKT